MIEKQQNEGPGAQRRGLRAAGRLLRNRYFSSRFKRPSGSWLRARANGEELVKMGRVRRKAQAQLYHFS
ncbi:MAG: hypothetical protein LBI19_09280 [Oscillospiraceae bacterium]|nr:hypothetical protein [Oscillospiraceae bacterium]